MKNGNKLKKVGDEVAAREKQHAERENIAGTVGQAGLVDHGLQPFHHFEPRHERDAAQLLLAQKRAGAAAGVDAQAAQPLLDFLADAPLRAPTRRYSAAAAEWRA